MNKILISGASGFIGSRLFDFLTSKGYSVTGLSHLHKKNPFMKISLLNYNTLNSYMKKNHFDTVIHLASLSEHHDPLKILNVNYTSTLNLLKSCMNNNVSNFIFASSHAVYGPTSYLPIDEEHPTRPQTSYGISKLICENLCKLFNNYFNLKMTILRISSVYGENQIRTKLIPNLILNSIHENKMFLHKYNNGFQLMDMIHVDDVCYSFQRSLEHKRNFGIYNIASGNSITVQDLAEIIQKINKSKIKINKLPYNTNHFKYNISKAKLKLKFSSKIKINKKIELIYDYLLHNN